MVNKDALKKIVMFTYLTDAMLDQLVPIIDVLEFEKDEVIFQESKPARRFFMLHNGHIILEQQISEAVTAIVGSIKPGFSFGWSAMLEDGYYTSNAVCAEPSEVYSLKRERILRLFENNPLLGLKMYQRLVVIIKKRLDFRTSQFKKAIMNHPDLQRLFATVEPDTMD